MEVQKKHAVLAALTLFLLVGVVGFAAFNQGVDYGVFLSEDMDVNRENEQYIGATVYYFLNGKLVASGHNVMTNVGLNASRHHLGDQTWVNNNATTNAYRWIGIGTGTGGGASSTDLVTPFDRQIGTFAEVASVTGNFTLTYTWAAGAFAGETISESGCFNAASGGIILNYQSFTGITLQATDSLQVQFMFQIS